MKLNSVGKSMKRAAQKGFTLVELAVVGVLLGLLFIYAISTFSTGASDAARANGLYESATKLGDAWSVITSQCGTTSDIGVSPLGGTPASAAKNLDLLLGFETVNSAYQACYQRSGIRPLNTLAQRVSVSGAQVPTVYDYQVALTSSGTNMLHVTFKGVPDAVFLPLYNKHSGVAGAASVADVTSLSAADSSDKYVRYTAPSGGVRDVTIIRPL